jgi:hypothetical protein
MAFKFNPLTSKLDLVGGGSGDTSAHNDLTGLQGGTTNEYYHVTSAEKTVMENTSGTNTGDQDLSGFITTAQVNDISVFGTGSDGDVVIAGTVVLTKDMYYNNLTVSAGAELKPDGYEVFVKDTLVVEATGIISSNGGVGNNTRTGSSPAGGLPAHTTTTRRKLIGNSTAGAQGTFTSVNPGTTNSGNGSGATAVMGTASFTIPYYLMAGNGGGSGGCHGSAGGNAQVVAKTLGGATGGNGGTATGTASVATRSGASGGGGGGVVAIRCNTIDNAGIISANGGAGGNGVTVVSSYQTGNGGGGGGGAVYLEYRTAEGSGVGTLTANGGVAGTGGNGGTNGSNGVTVAIQI